MDVLGSGGGRRIPVVSVSCRPSTSGSSHKRAVCCRRGRVQHYVSDVTIVSPTTFKFRGHTIWGVRRGEGWGW